MKELGNWSFMFVIKCYVAAMVKCMGSLLGKWLEHILADEGTSYHISFTETEL